MNTYSYAALGENNFYIKGKIKKRSMKKAVAELEKSGLILINIEKEKSDSWKDYLKYSSITRQDKIVFTRHMQSFFEAGISLNQAVKIAAKQTKNHRFGKILSAVYEELLKGNTLGDSLSVYKKNFSNYFIQLIKVGESSGTLDETFKHLLEQQEKEYDLISTVRGAMIYPAVIMFAAIAIVAFMMSFVIPTVASTLTEYGGELPLQTKILIAVSNFTVDYGLMLLPAVFLFFIGIFYFLKKVKKARWIFENLLFKLPLVGKMMIEFNLARFARSMSAPLQSGISLDKSLILAADVSNNLHYKKAIGSAVDIIRKGVPLSEVLKGYPDLFPHNVVSMLEIGEKTGKIDNMFLKLAKFYERSVFYFFKNISTIIEPILLILIGLCVGFIAVSILTPIWKFTETI